MNTNMQGHHHGGRGHLLWMFGIGALVLVVLLGTGRSLLQALPVAVFLACPLMMVGMMFMMHGGNGHQHDDDATDHRDHDAVAESQDSAGTPAHPRRTTATLP
jgi:choline-glycine betaine transporter